MSTKLKNISDSSIVICALARDCASALQSNIPRIEELRSHFKKSTVIAIENDSKDETKQVLNAWKESSNNVFINSEDYEKSSTLPAEKDVVNKGTGLQRIQKMVTLRNMYLNWIERQTETFDLIIVLDVDIEWFSVKGVLSSIEFAPDNWGGIFANGYTTTKILTRHIYPIYYDMFAYSEESNIACPDFSLAKMFKQRKILRKLLNQNKYVPVKSAFGGLGIYKTSVLEGLRYEALKNNDMHISAVCEHIPFNYSLINKGFANYISSELEVRYGRSNPLTVVRDLLPLNLFKIFCLILTFKKLKQ